MNSACSAGLRFQLAQETFSIWRLPPEQPVDWEKLAESSWYSVTCTTDEISVVAPEGTGLGGDKCETGWRGLKIEGPLAFGLIGIVAGVSGVLAEAKISIFAVSTYDTDYFFVKAVDVERAITALEAAGHSVNRLPPMPTQRP